MTHQQHGYGSSRTAAVVGIFSRVQKDSVTWLSNFLTEEFQDLVSEVGRISWEREVKQCSAGILYLSMPPGQVYFTDVERTTLTWDLQYLHSALGREKILVVLDNMTWTDENERQRILNTEPKLRQQASQLILIPHTYKRQAASCQRFEFREFLQRVVLTLQPEQTSLQNRNPAVNSRFELNNVGIRAAKAENKKEGGNFVWGIIKGVSSALIGNNSPQNKPELSPLPQYRIRIFSRAGESHYSWLISQLKSVEGMGPPDIRGVCLTNDHNKFTEEARDCDFAILYHSLRHGRLNISDVTDALYDTELQDLPDLLGKEKVIVVADDLKTDGHEEKDRILQNQPSIAKYARDLFLFREGQKNPQNLFEISQVIQSMFSEFVVTPRPHQGTLAVCSPQGLQKGALVSSVDPSLHNRPPGPPLSQHRIRIFSRAAESHYCWLIDGLKAGEGMGSADIKGFCILNNNYTDFKEEARTCHFAILYHSRKHGRLNITDVTDSLYDKELRDLSELLRQEKVIVVLEDLTRADQSEKDRIIRNQPSIARYAKDLFLFTEGQKNPQNISEISRIIIQRDLQHQRFHETNNSHKEKFRSTESHDSSNPNYSHSTTDSTQPGSPVTEAKDHDLSSKPSTSPPGIRSHPQDEAVESELQKLPKTREKEKKENLDQASRGTMKETNPVSSSAETKLNDQLNDLKEELLDLKRTMIENFKKMSETIMRQEMKIQMFKEEVMKRFAELINKSEETMKRLSEWETREEDVKRTCVESDNMSQKELQDTVENRSIAESSGALMQRFSPEEDDSKILKKSFLVWLDILQLSFIITKEETLQVKQNQAVDGKVKALLEIIQGKDASTQQEFRQYLQRQRDKETMFQQLLEKMRVTGPKSCKLTLQDVLQVSPEDLMDESSADGILWCFVRRLISLKSDAWKFMIKFEESVNHENEEEEEYSFLLADISDLQNGLHPLDVVCAAFHCSDHFLHQEMASKMAMCQFAVPLLLPAADGPQSTFMLWAMRDIVKKWRPQSLADKKEFQEDSLVNISMPVISFVRLGNCRLSKSKILNQLLSSKHHQHDIFVHRDMEGGTAERTISEGLVEMSWYFPAGKGNFPEPVAFTNLRGGLESNLRQFTFLTEVSSVVVVLMASISEDQCQRLLELNSSGTKYLFVINKIDNKTMKETDERLKPFAVKLKLTQKNVLVIPKSTNEATTTSKIIQSLLPLIQNKSITLKEMANQASNLGFYIDEDAKGFQTSERNAKKISADIEDVGKYKKKTMKLQADPLRRLAKLEKEMCQMKLQGNENGEIYKSDLRRQCDSIREIQWESEIPKGILQFINALQSPNMAEKMYFLKWLRLNLDSVTRKCLSPLQAEYKEKCSSSYNHKELSELDQKISDSSLGIEHFLREVGQLYEAWHFMGERKSPDVPFESLPEMAADLLLNGFPLELLDGDASRIPLQWIKDVWSQVDKKTQGRSRLRVITVLGVQSTGKSTLLNTMFGLQFPVASGRCTRGAFMTLLKVTESYQEELRCQFLLVIDTEGLKAPELDSLDGSYEHDNKLATLVIGLSDIMVINMAMENTSEMKDILQIVIHAFLRMKEIGKKTNCHFVHQNVSDVSAPVMNMRGRKKLVDQFDEMTRTVAEMEKRPQLKSFSDVMEYDLDHHNWYIPGLWHGVPPMASISSAYSEQVTEMKKELLNSMRGNQSATHTIPEFITWMTDLWSAVKHENFIFSFRNSFIAKAYNQLSAKYSECEWKFNKSMHEWLTKSETLIKNQPAETLEAKANECRREADHILTSSEQEILTWLDEYFEQEKECSQLIKYKTDFVISAKNLRKNLEMSSLNKLKEQINIQHLYSEHIRKIEHEVSALIDECRSQNIELKGNVLAEKLDIIFKETVKDLVPSPLPNREIEREMLRVLSDDMKEEGVHMNFYSLSESRKVFPQLFQFFKSIRRDGTGQFTEAFIQSVVDKCCKYAEKLKRNYVDYNDTHCKEILRIIDDMNEKEGIKGILPTERELDLKLKVLGHVLGTFKTMHSDFVRRNDPRLKLESLKSEYFQTIHDVFQKTHKCQILTKRICENILEPSLTDYIYRRLGIEVVDDILQRKGSEKYSSRKLFQFTVLKSLLEENNVKNFIEYTENYESFVKFWILNSIVREYNINVLLNDILTRMVARIESILINPDVSNHNDVSSFLAHMSEELESDLVLPQEKIKAIIFQNSASVGDFVKYMNETLKDTEQKIRSELEAQKIEDILCKATPKPHDLLFEIVSGCGKQCPFCKCPCEAGGADHTEHFASMHRPQGLGGYKYGDVLCHDICSTSVTGNQTFLNPDTNWRHHPFKDYRHCYPDWKIQPDASIEASDYWKFVLKEFNREFSEEYNTRPANYPGEWRTLTREKAMESLRKAYNME